MIKKYLLFFAVLSFALVVTSAVVADDEDENHGQKKGELKRLGKTIERLERFELPEIESSGEHPASFFVGPKGQVRVIAGEITELAGAVTPPVDGVKVWGLNLKVNMENANFIPPGTTRASLKVGDTVNIKGRMNKDTGVIEAATVHALSSRDRMADELFQQILRLIEKIRELQQKAGLPLTPLPTPSSP